MSCKCNGTGWTCEQHDDKPMDHDGCKGPGEPCSWCNPMSAHFYTTRMPDWRVGEIMREINDRVNGSRRYDA